jgi:SAM-dependent methyltransferase
MTAERRAWDEYWKEQGPSGAACLERAPAPLRSALARHWCGFAATLPARARVLDVGCGSGAVGRAIAACRPDLRLYGADYAAVEGVGHRAYAAIQARVPMESLPFESGWFEGAVSQFGFEYSRMADSVAELARVLAPGAPLSLIVHHAEGPITTDNRRSLLAYRRLLSPEMERLFIAGDCGGVERIATVEAARLHDPTVDLVIQSLRGRIAAPHSVRMKTWRTINEALEPELALAAALDRIAVGPASLDRWLAPFGGRFDDLSACPFEVAGVPFAWRIRARRRQAAAVAKIREALAATG